MAHVPPPGRDGCDPRQHLYTRRGFLGVAGWGAVLGSLGVGTFAFGRFLYPRVLYEPATVVKLGAPDLYAENTVSERWLADHRLWVVRLRDGLIAVSARCTHLGCTPMWLEAENRFRCPCHGSGFRGIDRAHGAPNWTGVSFEGPAPRALERFPIGLADDGQVVVDTGRVLRMEENDRARSWLAADAVLRIQG